MTMSADQISTACLTATADILDQIFNGKFDSERAHACIWRSTKEFIRRTTHLKSIDREMNRRCLDCALQIVWGIESLEGEEESVTAAPEIVMEALRDILDEIEEGASDD